MSLEVISLTPAQALGIPVALVGSIFLAAGAEFQQHGVAKVHDRETAAAKRSGLGMRQLLALVITAIITARITKTKLTAASIRAILYCVGGVGLFVCVAALTTTTVPITDAQLGIVMIILVGVLIALGLTFVLLRNRFTRMFYVAAAGVLFGFVATLAKVLITRIQTIIHGGLHLTPADWLTIACLLGLVAATILGTYFVQTAYSSGSPELVVARLTVIDPLVWVTIGIIVLGEATSAPILGRGGIHHRRPNRHLRSDTTLQAATQARLAPRSTERPGQTTYGVPESHVSFPVNARNP